MKILLLCLLPSVAFADFKWGQRYSHSGHAEQMRLKNQTSPACKSCHMLDTSLKPIPPGKFDHKPCTECHTGGDFSRGNRCLTCHSSIRTMKPGKPWFPPYRSPGDFHVQFSHAKHATMQQTSGEPCGGCHREQLSTGKAPQSGHQQCNHCHANTEPIMSSCEGCHKLGPAEKKTLPTKISEFRMFDYSHQGHDKAAKVKNVQANCGSCHLGMNEEHPAHPKMKTCENCHDGKKAFDARGTQCSRCHKGERAPTGALPRKQLFSHTRHGQKMQLEPCSQCHSAGNNWKAAMPGRNDHKPCTNEGCHAPEFGKIGSELCLVCHERNDPIAGNPLRRPTATRENMEWQTGAFPHPPHLTAGAQCAMCHGDMFTGQKPGKEGHALCGQCHNPNTKVTMASCRACHVPIGTVTAATMRPFSTRARFEHNESHRTKCEACHRSEGTAELTPPKMAGCGDCHDGKKAFKVTGFGCLRCHGGAKKK